MSKSVTDPLHYLVKLEKKKRYFITIQRHFCRRNYIHTHTNTKETEGEKKIDILICGLSSRSIIHPEKYHYCHSSQAGRLIGTAVAGPVFLQGKPPCEDTEHAKGLPGVTI